VTKKPKILAIIPARGGSKSIPKKNIRPLFGKPLIEYTINSAKQSEYISKLIVSSDDNEIIKIAKSLVVDVPFIRPQHLAQSDSGSLEVVQHAVEFYEKKDEYFDAVLLLQPTTPFRAKNFIDEAITTFTEKKCDALVSVLHVPHQYNPHWVFEKDKSGYLTIATGESEIIKRRQDLPKAFFRDGSIYLTKTEVIKNGSLYGSKLSHIESSSQYYVNIDDENDWKKAEFIVDAYLKSQL